MLATTSRQHLIRHDDQSVTCEQSQRLAKLLVNRDLAASDVGIVKTRHVVVHQGCTVHQFNGNGSRVGQRSIVFPAGLGHGQTQLRADASAAWKHRMAHGGHQAGRGTVGVCQGEMVF
jgi:hypothetical protein